MFLVCLIFCLLASTVVYTVCEIRKTVQTNTAVFLKHLPHNGHKFRLGNSSTLFPLEVHHLCEHATFFQVFCCCWCVVPRRLPRQLPGLLPAQSPTQAVLPSTELQSPPSTPLPESRSQHKPITPESIPCVSCLLDNTRSQYRLLALKHPPSVHLLLKSLRKPVLMRNW